MDLKTRLLKILHFPFFIILLELLACGLAVGMSTTLFNKLLSLTSINPDIKNLITGIIAAIIAIVTYVLLNKYYEKRSVPELSKKGFSKYLGAGIALGALLQSLTILTIAVYGTYKIVSVNPLIYIIPPLTMAFTSAIIEEIMVRGIIFRVLENRLGSYIALIISALFFGLAHLGNPNSSILVGIGLAIQAGLLLGASYIYSRSLWMPIGIHFAWNFMQSAIFGARVSGNQLSRTLISSEIYGPDWLTGGPFGPEGSIQATLYCSIAAIILLYLSISKGKIKEPFWKKATK